MMDARVKAVSVTAAAAAAVSAAAAGVHRHLSLWWVDLNRFQVNDLALMMAN
jgi:hypothetical protein